MENPPPKTANTPAIEHKIAAADGITEDQLKAYIKTITSVTVGDKTYAGSLHVWILGRIHRFYAWII